MNLKTKKQIAAYCQSLGDDVYEDYPFDETCMVMRHREGAKIICLCDEQDDGRLWVNVKCDPDYREYWLQKYPGSVEPGFHQNKLHWLSVVLDGSVAREDVESMLQDFYILTKKHKRK